MLFSRGTYRQSGVCIVLKPSACDLLIELDRIAGLVREAQTMLGGFMYVMCYQKPGL